MVPGDPVKQILMQTDDSIDNANQQIANQKLYLELKKKLGLDKPLFYFTLTRTSYPDTLHKIHFKTDKNYLERLINQHGNWEKIQIYYKNLLQLNKMLLEIPSSKQNKQTKIQLLEKNNEILKTYEAEKTHRIFQDMLLKARRIKDSSLMKFIQKTEKSFTKIQKNSKNYQNYIPQIYFNGFQNQYHIWLSNFLQGDFGYSYTDGKEVTTLIRESIRWTIILSLGSAFIAFLIAIPLGVFTGKNKTSKSSKIIEISLLMLYSLPTFWIATMLINFLASGDYFAFFPVYGISDFAENASLFEKIGNILHHLVLPLFCMTYGSLAFLSMQLSSGISDIIKTEFIKTAKAKGLPEKKIIWKHTFRNSLLPIITVFASIFPMAISGSVIIEGIFAIPGMGGVSLNAIYTHNYPVIFSVLMIGSILTLTGTLVSDILYKFADPRINFE